MGSVVFLRFYFGKAFHSRATCSWRHEKAEKAEESSCSARRVVHLIKTIVLFVIETKAEE